MQPGDRLPASRTLAHELGLSRTTVIRAYEQLLDEGYADARSGSGTHVSRTLPLGVLSARTDVPENAPDTPELSGLAQRIVSLRRSESPVNPFYYQLPRAFSPASPALDAFPHRLWGRSLQAAWRALESGSLNYQSALSIGYEPLRVALARYSQQVRGVRCTPEQVIITSGTQEALWALTRLLLEPGDVVWTEDPGHKGAHLIFQAAAARVVPVSVGPGGLDVEEGWSRAPDARLAYVTPSHQHPLGVTMSLGRRAELLGWAQRSGAWLVEDDYDSEFRYSGHPLESLQGLDRAGRVIYLMTFSKTLFPALRLGYMVCRNRWWRRSRRFSRPRSVVWGFWNRWRSTGLSKRVTLPGISARCAPCTPSGKSCWSRSWNETLGGCSPTDRATPDSNSSPNSSGRRPPPTPRPPTRSSRNVFWSTAWRPRHYRHFVWKRTCRGCYWDLPVHQRRPRAPWSLLGRCCHDLFSCVVA